MKTKQTTDEDNELNMIRQQFMQLCKTDPDAAYEVCMQAFEADKEDGLLEDEDAVGCSGLFARWALEAKHGTEVVELMLREGRLAELLLRKVEPQ